MSFGISIDPKKRKFELKLQGAVDCSPKEAMSVKPDLNYQREQSRKQGAKLAQRLHEAGVLKQFPSFVKTFYGGMR